MHSSVPLLKFDKHGDIRSFQSDEPINHQQSSGGCLPLIQYTLHQISLILLVLIYLLCGGFFFACIESEHHLKQDDARKQMIRETHETIRALADELLNEELDENFEQAYYHWRWNETFRSDYINLNRNRSSLFEQRTDAELGNLSLRLAMRQIVVDRYTYKWTYSTAILYAATLVTTIDYGNISPKTSLGKVCTIIYALFGILLVVSWLKSSGEVLALFVARYYQRFKQYLQGKHRHVANHMHVTLKVPAWVPVTLLLLYLVAGSLIFAVWEGWSYIDGAYFSFITFTTIGFGDLVPGEGTMDHRNGRVLLCAGYLLFGVMLTAMSFALIQEDIDWMKTRLLQRLGIDQINLPRMSSK